MKGIIVIVIIPLEESRGMHEHWQRTGCRAGMGL